MDEKKNELKQGATDNSDKTPDELADEIFESLGIMSSSSVADIISSVTTQSFALEPEPTEDELLKDQETLLALSEGLPTEEETHALPSSSSAITAPFVEATDAPILKINPDGSVPGEALFRLGQRMVLRIPHYEDPIEGRLFEIGVLYIAVEIPDFPIDDYINAPPADEPLTVNVFEKVGIYEAPSKYRSNALLPEKIFYIDKPECFRRQQQRAFVRVPAPLPIRYRTENIYSAYQKSYASTLIDISGSGLCFVSDKEIPVTATISLQIEELPILGKLSLIADVIRCREIKVPAGVIYHVGVCFEDYITRPDHNRLMRAISSLQRNHLRQGLR